MSTRNILSFFLVFLCVTALFSATATAQASPTYYQKLSAYVNSYNAYAEKIPGAIKMLFGKERINIHIALPGGGEETLGVVFSAGGKKIESFESGALEKPTLRVYVDGTAIDGVLQNPSMDAALEVIAGMKIEGVGLLKKAKVLLFNLASTVLSWLQ